MRGFFTDEESICTTGVSSTTFFNRFSPLDGLMLNVQLDGNVERSLSSYMDIDYRPS